ncbi:MAG: hypothetical protein KTR29_14610 [Rhodothermaceae bacterium]|nr:hypothetical protein [Rhodothermaceae bacterium]
MSILRLPVTGNINATVFPHVESFDAIGTEPADWHLGIALESAAPISIQAVCNGWISTVPPSEVLSVDFGILPDQIVTAGTTTRFYLLPEPAFVNRSQEDLEREQLSNAIEWILYDNIDAQSLAQGLLDAIDKTFFSHLSDNEFLDLFFSGQANIFVQAGTTIGYASTDNAHTGGHYRAEFGVRNKHGYIDPVAFYSSMSALLQEEEATLADLETTVFSPWPILADGETIDNLKTEASQKLYPNAVLQEALDRLQVEYGGDDWREVADTQKFLYLDRLYNNNVANGGPPFVFNREEMSNPFQLEAIAEFFNWWQNPAIDPLPERADWSNLSTVNFSDDDFHLVLIDAFDDPKLGSPELPKPEWSVNPWKIKEATSTENGGDDVEDCLCDPSVETENNYLKNEDTFRGTLFLVHKGAVISWYRWSSYTSHRWEDILQHHCDYASSIQGNLKYKFESRYSGTRNVNYCFKLWYDGDDPTILSTRTGAQSDYAEEAWVPGRFYFRDNGAGIQPDPDGKTWVLLHMAHTEHDEITLVDQVEEDELEQYFSYTGSAGCIVSPSFYQFRKKMCTLYLDGTQFFLYNYMRKIESAGTHTQSLKLRDRGVSRIQKELWEGNISGTFWLIRPDEPTRK